MKKLIIVDDNIFLQKTILEKLAFFEDINCKFCANDGKDLLKKLEDNHNIDLILMDINMPLINGFETTKKIREKGITIPIIALTAFDKEEVTEEAISVGMNDIMVKPFEPSKLFQVISNQIKQNENAG